MHKLGLILVFILFTFSVKAQDGSLFDFQIEKSSANQYDLELQLTENTNVQYIQFHFLEKGNLIAYYEASLNKKNDGKYYLYFNNIEEEVFLDNISLTFIHDFGVLIEPAFMVMLVDKDLNKIDSYQKNFD